jgi:hypothetical protein
VRLDLIVILASVGIVAGFLLNLGVTYVRASRELHRLEERTKRVLLTEMSRQAAVLDDLVLDYEGLNDHSPQEG